MTSQLLPDDDDDRLPDAGALREALERRQQLVAARVAAEREKLRRDWLATGGSEEEFDQLWPEIQLQLNRMRVMEIGERARTRSIRLLLPRQPEP